MTTTDRKGLDLREFEGLALVSSVGMVIGVFDFFLFELHRNSPVFYELIFSKPSFFRPSYLTVHLLTFFYISLVVFLFTSLIETLFFKTRFPKSTTTVVSFFLFSLIILIFRIKRISEQTIAFSSFVFIFIGTAFVLKTICYSQPRSEVRTQHGFHILSKLFFVFALSIGAVGFLAPDAQMLRHKIRAERPEHQYTHPNIILLVLDTVRSDHLSCYGYTGSHTPNIDALAGEGLVFKNAYSTAPWTLPSHASMFTGLLPTQHNATWDHRALTEDNITIAEVLGDAGYRTAGFCENPNISRSNGLAQGFSEFHDLWRSPLFFRALSKLNDQFSMWPDRRQYANRTLGLCNRWILSDHNPGKPFFAYVNLMAAHHPRYPRRSISRGSWTKKDLVRIEPVNLVPERHYIDRYRLTDDELLIMRDIYDDEISYLDRRIGLLRSFLTDHDFLDNTVLIVTSDHGEMFGEHGFIEHQLCLYEPVLKVPFIVRYPRLIESKNIEERVSTKSVFSIIERLSETSYSGERTIEKNRGFETFFMERIPPIISEYSSGEAMLRHAIQGESPQFEFERFDRDIRSIIVGHTKLISYSGGEEELFDLENDPLENHDLSKGDPRSVSILKELLAAHLGKMGDNKIEESHQIDSATSDALKALGYAQ